ncbi:MAG TPA: ATP-dependent helicase HrpB [candidate division Zixibacteria bacterium]|nr:ATP-dependent helicase HrpB [candidate division Zixibacteria bacterium]
MNRTTYPIHEIEEPLLQAARRFKRVVLTAPTGSGKSTQVPQMLLDGGLLGDGQVMVLQPRRLPARMLARWVAEARGVQLGAEVGYQMRFESAASAATRICYVTEGVLLRRMIADPDLRGIRALVFDEFHERHLYGDITLARALELQESTRPDLILLVMSATLDAAPLESYLRPCERISSQGRTYPVDIEYLPRAVEKTPVWELAARELRRLLREHPAGDALVFMPGTYEIARTVDAARAALGPEFVVLPLHGELPRAEQDAAVARYERRKVVVATNVAETSLTIDGVRLVIDTGLARIPRYDPYRGINTLLVEKISRAAADQRAGRAGRTAPGRCLRLWTVHEHAGRPAQELPEIKRLDLSEAILTLKATGVRDIRAFRWLEPPEPRALERAETLLADLGAIDGKTGAVTELGRRMLAFPAHPRYARMLLAARDHGCVRPVALIAAITQGRDLLARRKAGSDSAPAVERFGVNAESDFFVLARAWQYAERCGYDPERCRRYGINVQAARRVRALFDQFLEIAAAEGLDVSERPIDDAAVRRCVLVGFSDHLARRLDAASARCELVHGRKGVLARESAVKAPLLVACEVREVESGGGRERALSVVLSLATAVEESWLRELFPDELNRARAVVFDPALRRVVVRDQRRFRDLVLEESIAGDPPLDEAAEVLAREIAAGRCALENWNDAVEQWILRVNRLREWMPELSLPPIGEDDRAAMLQLVCHGAVSEKEVRERPVLPVVKSWLSAEQQAWVEEHAPERIRLPRGRAVKVSYSEGGPPTIAARIQDLYGVDGTLRIAARRVPVRVEVLAPSNRPVQVTENLSAFWRDTYPKLKQQLRRRYPRHEWR